MKKRSLSIIFFIIVILFYFVRVYNLDQDLPPWGIGYYQPVDEGAYSLLALNYIHFGSINPAYDNVGHAISTPLQCRTNIIGNIVSIFFMNFLGNNYYGFRMGYIFWGLLVLAIYILCIKSICKNYTDGIRKNIVITISVVAILFDFMFYMASRTVENSIVRLTFNLLIVYVCFKLENSYRLRFFLISFFAIISVFLIYITNIFVCLAVFLYILNVLLVNKDKNQKTDLIIYSILGMVVAIIVSELYYKIFWQSSLIDSTLSIINSFSSSTGYTITGNTETGGVLKAIMYKVLAFSGANSLLYNLPVLFLSVAFFPYILLKYVKKGNRVSILFYIIISFLAQTLFIEDCIGRKIIVIYPCFILLILDVIVNREHFESFLTRLNIFGKLIYAYYILFDILLCGFVLIYRFKFAQDNTNLDFDTSIKVCIIIFGFNMACICFVSIFSCLCKGTSKYLNVYNAFLISMFCAILFNGSLIYKFSLKEPTFYDRDAMIELNDYIGKKDIYVTGGGFQLGFALYNDMQYIMQSDMEGIKNCMESDDNVYIIDYEQIGDWTTEFFNEYYFDQGEYTLEPVYIIHRNYQAYGIKRNFCLYKKIKYER